VINNATGQQFQVHVTNPAAMAAIHVGSKLYGSPTIDIFSVNHLDSCCAVMS